MPVLASTARFEGSWTRKLEDHAIRDGGLLRQMLYQCFQPGISVPVFCEVTAVCRSSSKSVFIAGLRLRYAKYLRFIKGVVGIPDLSI